MIARRATDPDDSAKGPIDSVVLNPVSIPSHQGIDVNTVLSNFPVVSMAFKIPTTHMHLHSLIVSVKGAATRDSVINKLENTTRVMLINGKKDGFKSTANIIDLSERDGKTKKRYLRIRRVERFGQGYWQRDSTFSWPFTRSQLLLRKTSMQFARCMARMKSPSQLP